MSRIILSTLIVFGLLTHIVPANAQETYKEVAKIDSALVYYGGSAHEVEYFKEPNPSKKPKNVILMIGDGMGTTQIFSALVGNHGKLYIQNFKKTGFITTHASNKFVTDSGAGGTALATGKKTYNGAIGVGPDTLAIENIREKAEKAGKSTGVISTSAITHATPASFLAHQGSRSSYEDIASDILKTNVDVFIGGGYKHFAVRKDGTNLIPTLKAKGYQVCTTMVEVAGIKSGKLAALVASEHTLKMEEGRGDMLPTATRTAINILSQNKKGFFMMVEGSQIDWAGHQNNTSYMVTEVIDFDKAIGEALRFASSNKETLVIVTADHETGGFALVGGDYKTGKVVGAFPVDDHTGVMVPVFAFGPGSEQFTGIYDNTEIAKRIEMLLGFK